MRTAYEVLLRLYPTPYREVFGTEMAAVFAEVQADYQSRGLLEYVAFLFAELTGLISGAFSTWGEEYLARTRRRPVVSYWISIAAGVAITVFFQWFFYEHVGRVSALRLQQTEASPSVTPEYFVPMLIAGGILLFISVFSIAFVWNMRIIGNRAGRLKPIWMPGAGNVRTAARRTRHGLRR